MRGDGATARQMLGAPRHAFYIWCNTNLMYPQQLARLLGRTDLWIIAPEYIEKRLAGRGKIDIVIDHATHLSHYQRVWLQASRATLHHAVPNICTCEQLPKLHCLFCSH